MLMSLISGEKMSICRYLAVGLISIFLAAANFALAQGRSYPSQGQPIKSIVPFGPGGSADIIARMFGQYVEGKTNQPVIVENKPGASGMIGTEFVKNSAPDGYTLLLSTNTTLAANMGLFKKVPYDPIKDFQHIGMFGSAPLAVLVLKDSGLNSINDLVTYAKANPGKVFYGYYNSASQMAAELFRTKTGAPLMGIPYKTIGNAEQDLYGKQVQVIFMEYLPATAQIDGGKVIALGVTGTSRYSLWPQVPTIAQTYPGYELSFWAGLAAPAGTPPDVVRQLDIWLTDALKDPSFAARLKQYGLEPAKLSQPEYQRYVGSEIKRWGQMIRDAKIEPQ
jgi:tripartite-type tricarboxylate transporter receptor subunit TctC